MASLEQTKGWKVVAVAWECVGAVVFVLGVFLAFGPYQDDRTWNLRRDSAKNVEQGVLAQDPTHFRLRQVIPTYQYDKWNSNPTAFLRVASPVLFVPGHMGKWTQVINIASYINRQRKVPVWSLDFHANPAGWHSSVLIQQAEFVAAAMESISEVYLRAGLPGPQITVIGHSMGGIVAMEAIRHLAARRSDTQVRSLILLCTPILGHPLLIEPRSSIFLENSRIGFWGSAPPFTLVLAPGDTDPMVPTEVVAVPENAHGATLLSGSVHGLHSSFSHVNILFSRSSLHTICRLVGAAVDGNLPMASQKLVSPLLELFQASRNDTKNMLSQLTLQSFMDETIEDTWVEAKIVAIGTVGFETIDKYSLARLPDGFADIGIESIAWSQLHEGKVHFVRGSGKANVFDLVLFEEPRPIRRDVEKGSRGENFDEKDIVNCTALAIVWVGSMENQATAAWKQIKPFSLQYPTKTCIFRFSIPDQPSQDIPVVAIRRNMVEKSKGKRLRIAGFAQWHSDILRQSEQNGAVTFHAFSSWHDWVKALFEPRRVTLPVGRACVSHIAVPFEDKSPFYPFDIHATGGFSAPWNFSGLFLSTDLQGAGVHVAALNADELPHGWAAETNPRMFAPRYVPAKSAHAIGSWKHPQILVVSDPSVEITLHVTANFWSALIRVFRTYLGHVIASLCGAMLVVTYCRVACECKLLYIAMWALTSSTLTIFSADAPQANASYGYSPGPPPLFFLVWLHFFSAGCAMLCLRSLHLASRAMYAAFRCGSSFIPVPFMIDIILWVIALGIHPAACLLALNTRGVFLLGKLQRTISISSGPDEDGKARAMETPASWLIGMVGLQFIYTLFYTPSIILTGWLLNGQHKEASSSNVQAALDADLKVSKHSFSPFVDSYLLEHRTELRKYIELPALGLVLPAISLAVYASISKRLRDSSCMTECNRQGRFAMLCRCILLIFAVSVVPIVGHRPYRLWFVCQPVFLLFAFVALSVHFGQSGDAPKKME